MPSFVDCAVRGMKKHPEIFAALEEFERTKKVPRFTYHKRLDITISEDILEQFRDYCQKHGLGMSRTIEAYMKEELAASRAGKGPAERARRRQSI